MAQYHLGVSYVYHDEQVSFGMVLYRVSRYIQTYTYYVLTIFSLTCPREKGVKRVSEKEEEAQFIIKSSTFIY